MEQTHAERRPYDQDAEPIAKPIVKDEERRAQEEKLKADLDAITDDIDKVLVENAAEFVESFVQKGGE
jgi:ubiquitin-like protein Pup